MRWINNFVELTRAYALSVTFASCFIIYAYANYNENFNIINFILLVFALCLVHLGANLFDDLIDVKLKLKQVNQLSDVHFDNFTPKARLITEKIFSFKEIYILLSIFFILATIIGIYFTLISGWQILLFILAGGILTIFYPISAKYYLAEIIIGLIYGPLIINGGYFALTGNFDFNLFIFTWAIFFSCLVLLHTHNIMDYEFDVKNNKNTLCRLFKTKKDAVKGLLAIITASYLIVLFGVLNQNLNPKMLYVFLTLPIATKLIESMNDYINIKDVKFEPRWYYGTFENWKQIKNLKIDFFMFRFYLARNFGFYFALFASIGAMT